MSKNVFNFSTKSICITALFTAMNVVMSSLRIPVLGGGLYLNDIVICIAAILLNPIEAFIVGGLGAFLGDFFFYPVAMWYSFVIHGLQAVVISVFAHYILKKHQAFSSAIGVTIGAIIMVAGYSLCKAFFYGTPEGALLKLPFQILQAALGAVLGMIICYPLKIRSIYEKMFIENKKDE